MFTSVRADLRLDFTWDLLLVHIRLFCNVNERSIFQCNEHFSNEFASLCIYYVIYLANNNNNNELKLKSTRKKLILKYDKLKFSKIGQISLTSLVGSNFVVADTVHTHELCIKCFKLSFYSVGVFGKKVSEITYVVVCLNNINLFCILISYFHCC